MYTVGIDLGGTNIAIGICDEDLNIIAKASIPTDKSCGGEGVVAGMAALTKQLMRKNKIDISQIEYVGMALPGSIDSELGIIEYSNNLPFENFPICDEFRKRFNVEKIYIENDANAAALAEALCGVARGVRTSVMITLGTGVGGGVIIDGKIFKGGVNSAGAELGHTVIKAGGRLCTCGRRGCFEAYSSATGLITSTVEMMKELEAKGIPSRLFEIAQRDGKVSAKTAFEAKSMGDEAGTKLVNEYISDLAVGITNMVNIFQPEVLSIGGGVSNAGSELLIPLAKIVDREQYARNNPKKHLLAIAALKNDAGIIGAAGLGRQFYDGKKQR
ncbi:MAG: ROK family protein [Clostridia bacterium]|nr:ROK family protein [Clostridia bacterium]